MERFAGRHLRGAFLALLVSFGAVVGSADSQAQTAEESLVVLPVQFLEGSDGSEMDYVDAIEGEIKKRGQFALIRKSQAYDALQPSLPTHISTPVDQLLSVNRKLDEAEEKVFTEPGTAGKEIEAAIRDAEKLAGLLDSNSGYDAALFRGYMLRARAFMDSGETEKAKDALFDVVRIFGEGAEVTRESFHPSIVSLYEEVLRESQSAGLGNIDLTSSVKGAEILLVRTFVETQDRCRHQRGLAREILHPHSLRFGTLKGLPD